MSLLKPSHVLAAAVFSMMPVEATADEGPILEMTCPAAELSNTPAELKIYNNDMKPGAFDYTYSNGEVSVWGRTSPLKPDLDVAIGPEEVKRWCSAVKLDVVEAVKQLKEVDSSKCPSHTFKRGKWNQNTVTLHCGPSPELAS